MDYHDGHHSIFKIQNHFVFVTKYHYKVLKIDASLDARELIHRIREAISFNNYQ
jgi:putative transposase